MKIHAVLLLFISFLLLGCAPKPIVKTQYIDKPIPIKCVNDTPNRPNCNNLNTWKCLEAVLIYMGALEIIVNNCKE